MDTIFALASARGRAGVAVIRVSGPKAHDVLQALSGDVPSPRTLVVRTLRDQSGVVLDEALVVSFDASRSFTGEAVAEFHTHGSTAVIQAVLSELALFDGVRLAEPGEFTRRALENNRLDLAQVEGLGDLIASETEAQRKQAVRLFSGELGQKVELWRSKLVRAIALIEATIDFADEDVPEDVVPEVSDLIHGVRGSLQDELDGFGAAERLRNGFEVAVVGSPNVGKSTLLNRLAGREAAITSEHAGTTRDVIEVSMDLRGLPVTILDTAGIRKTDDAVELIGVERAMMRAEAADLRVFLISDSRERPPFPPSFEDMVLVGKSDIQSDGVISGKTGDGVDLLVDGITAVLEKRVAGASVANSLRHKSALSKAIEDLNSALVQIEEAAGLEFVALSARSAVNALEALVGRVGVEDFLDVIFAEFCLGK